MGRLRSGLLPWLTAAAFLVGLAVRPSAAQDRPLLIRASRLLDVTGGGVVRNAAITVREGRILAVGPAASVTPPEGTERIELGDLTLLPGLIDTHVHLTLGGNPADSNARSTLMAGFTTVQDLGALNYAVGELRDAIAAGRLTGPRVVAAGPWLGTSGATCDFQGIGVRGVDAFRGRVREDLRHNVDVIKVCVTSWPRQAFERPDAMEIEPAELAAVVEEAHDGGKRVVAHAIGAAGIRMAIQAGVDAIAHAGFADSATLQLMKARRVFLIPTLWSFSNARTQPFGTALFVHMRAVLASGAPIAFGTDAGVVPHGRNATEFTWMVQLGMSPLAAIQAATVVAAQALGLFDRIGSLRPGKEADVIAVAGNPLEDITALQRVVFVMRGGRVVRNDRAPGG